MLVNIIIVLILAYGAYRGYRRGFITVMVDLIGLGLALLVGVLSYHLLAHWVASFFKVIPSFSQAIAYLFIVVIFEILYTVITSHILARVSPALMKSMTNRIGGIVANFVRVLALIMVALVIYAALPMTAGEKQTITNAMIPQLLLSYGGTLQQGFNKQFGGAITDTINFFTVEPASDKTIKLDFTTTNVRDDTLDEDRMLVLINRERSNRELPPLAVNAKAQEVARAHSRDMFARGFFSHINPDGKDPFQRMKAGKVTFGAAGENLALAPTLELAQSGLMNSPGHRANILSTDYHSVGIGIIDGGAYGLMITQDFTD